MKRERVPVPVRYRAVNSEHFFQRYFSREMNLSGAAGEREYFDSRSRMENVARNTIF